MRTTDATPRIRQQRFRVPEPVPRPRKGASRAPPTSVIAVLGLVLVSPILIGAAVAIKFPGPARSSTGSAGSGRMGRSSSLQAAHDAAGSGPSFGRDWVTATIHASPGWADFCAATRSTSSRT